MTHVRYRSEGTIYDRVAGGAPVMAPDGERLPFTGSRGQVEEDIDAYARLGVRELIVDFRSEALADSLERMERFASEARPGATR